MKQAARAAERGLMDMLELIHDSRLWHSGETLKLVQNLENRLGVVKARTNAGIGGLHHRAK